MTDPFDLGILARNLERARLAQGMTQAEAAERAGIARRLYGHYERSHHWPSVRTLRRLSQTLEVSADTLLELPTDRPPALPGPPATPALRRLRRRLEHASPDVVHFMTRLLTEIHELEIP